MRIAPATLVFEPLESRKLLAAVFPTPIEQYYVEVINRMRANPDAEAARYGIDLNEGPPSSTISSAPKQPLAVNPYLTDAAGKHSEFMIANDQFEHFETVNGSPRAGYHSPGDRATTAGYTDGLPGFENIAWRAPGGDSPTLSDANTLHKNLFKDFTDNFDYPGRGHRINMLRPNLNQVGIGLANGTYQGHDAAFVTENFAVGNDTYLTGVVYEDSDGNDFYTPGEGKGGVTITAVRSGGGEFTETTWDAGGYTLPLPAGTYTVTASGGGLAEPLELGNVTVGDENEKVDFIVGGAAFGPPNLTPTLTVAGSRSVLVPGDKVTFRVALANGGGASNGSGSIKIYASTDGTLDTATDTRVKSVTRDLSVAGGDTKTIKIKATLGSELAPGDYTFFVVVDDGEAIEETDETDNTDAAPAAVPFAWQFGTVGNRANVATVITEADGTILTFSRTGPGTGTVRPSSEGNDLTVTDLGATTKITVTATLSETDGDDGIGSLRNVAIDGPIKSLLAAKIRVTGEAIFDDAVGSLKLRALDGAVVRAAGNVKKVTLGAMIDSLLFVGVPGSPTALPSALADLGSSRLGKLTVTGRAATPSFVNSNVAAFEMGKITLTDVETSNAGNEFGLAFGTVTKLKRKDAPGDVVSEADFEVRDL